MKFCGKSYLLILTALLLTNILLAQEKIPKYEFNGYVKDMQTVWIQDLDSLWLTDNLIHNRLNFKWYPNDQFTLTVEMRNRLIFGEILKYSKQLINYDSLVSQDRGIVDMKGVIASGNSYLLMSEIDRLNLKYEFGKLRMILGRQRINWGKTLVWNPNDIFNAYSYFDFDYEERPGTDAFRAEYYTGYASSIQLVYQFGKSWEESGVAAMYRFNKWNYDFQVFTGHVQKDYVGGVGWSGDIKGIGFRGEGTYFQSSENFSDTTGQFVGSISCEYVFKNSLMLNASVLYNSTGSTEKEGSLSLISNQNLSAKQFTRSKMLLFASATYPLTPIVGGSLSGMMNPFDQSFFVGPSFTFSMSDNFDLMIAGQLFFGEEKTEFGDVGQLAFIRTKWSF